MSMSTLKLVRVHLNTRKHFFVVRVTKHWNRLPTEIVESTSSSSHTGDIHYTRFFPTFSPSFPSNEIELLGLNNPGSWKIGSVLQFKVMIHEKRVNLDKKKEQ